MLASRVWDTDAAQRHYLSHAERLDRLDALANLLDSALLIPGTNIRIGLDAAVGLIPGIGDIITTATALYIVHEARQLGAPKWLVARMIGNVAVDGLVGAVPLLGDVFDTLWRANRRNVDLLRRHREWIRPSQTGALKVLAAIVSAVKEAHAQPRCTALHRARPRSRERWQDTEPNVRFWPQSACTVVGAYDERADSILARSSR